MTYWKILFKKKKFVEFFADIQIWSTKCRFKYLKQFLVVCYFFLNYYYFYFFPSKSKVSFFFSHPKIFFISLKHNIVIKFNPKKNWKLKICIFVRIYICKYSFKGTFYVIYIHHALKYVFIILYVFTNKY
jgi:hypothetical protein